jgi:hypothetical protein
VTNIPHARRPASENLQGRKPQEGAVLGDAARSLWGFGCGRARAEVRSEGRSSGEEGDAGRGRGVLLTAGRCVDRSDYRAVNAALERAEPTKASSKRTGSGRAPASIDAIRGREMKAQGLGSAAIATNDAHRLCRWRCLGGLAFVYCLDFANPRRCFVASFETCHFVRFGRFGFSPCPQYRSRATDFQSAEAPPRCLGAQRRPGLRDGTQSRHGNRLTLRPQQRRSVLCTGRQSTSDQLESLADRFR